MKQSVAAALLVMLFWALLPLLSLPTAGTPTAHKFAAGNPFGGANPVSPKPPYPSLRSI